jgi:uncharacterized protein DUF4386
MRSPNVKARIAGLFYLLTIVTGSLALAVAGGRSLVVSLSTLCYVGVTLIFYDLFKPVNMRLSFVAAGFSLTGCAFGILGAFNLVAGQINLGFFGLYCIAIGYLIVRSTFLPRSLGGLMIIGGLSWMTFFSPALARQLAPFNMLPGFLAEVSLTLWLLAAGVNGQRWRESATRASNSALLSATSFL